MAQLAGLRADHSTARPILRLTAALAELVRLQCRRGQGYHFARPLPADELSRYLHAQRGMQTAKPTVVAV
jgi:predicted signal transduction protein with EAL and GGDEF domain